MVSTWPNTVYVARFVRPNFGHTETSNITGTLHAIACNGMEVINHDA